MRYSAKVLAMSAEQAAWHKLLDATHAVEQCDEPATVEVETGQGRTRMCSCVVTLADASSSFATARAAALALGCSHWPAAPR